MMTKKAGTELISITNQPKKSKKAAKLKKAVKKAYAPSVNRYLKTINPYLLSVLNPFEITGCKIPDMNSTPSVTFTTIDRFQLAVNVNGVVGVFVALGTPSACIFLTTAAATPALLTWTVPGGIASYSSFSPLMSSIRLVSAGLAATYSGTTLTDSGRFLSHFIPRQNSFTLPPAASTDIINYAYTQVTPVKRQYSQTVYFPQDPSSLLYQNPGAVLGGGFGNEQQGYFGVVGDGMTSTQIVQFTLIQNWEAIPSTSTLSWLTPQPSWNDPIELAHAQNSISSTQPTIQPPLGITPASGAIQAGVGAMAGAAGMSTSKHEIASLQEAGSDVKSGSSFLDRIMGFADSDVMKTVGKVAEVAAPILSMFL